MVWVLLALMAACGAGDDPAPTDLPLTAEVQILGAGAQAETGEPVQLRTNIDASRPGVAFFWEFGDGTTSDRAEPTKTYSTPGRYTISLTVLGRAGERRRASLTLVAGRFSLVKQMSCQGGSDRSGWCQWPYQPELVRMGFFDERNGWALTRSALSGEGSLWRTEDGGQSWTPLHAGPGDARDALFPTPTTGVVLTSSGVVWFTIDGGRQWTQRGTAQLKASDGSLSPLTPNHGRIDAASRDVTQLQSGARWSRDGGLTWTLAPNPIELTRIFHELRVGSLVPRRVVIGI